VRTWKTDYRGPLLICASSSPRNQVFSTEKGDFLLPPGVMVCIVNLHNIRPMKWADEDRAMCEYQDGAYAWEVGVMEHVMPKPIKGKLHVFDVEDELVTPLDIAADDHYLLHCEPPYGFPEKLKEDMRHLREGHV